MKPTEKPPMLSRNLANDISALREYLYRITKTLDERATETERRLSEMDETDKGATKRLASLEERADGVDEAIEDIQETDADFEERISALEGNGE